jgi:hypothetical protein
MKGVLKLPSTQLIELVHQLRKSGIKISISAPRSKTMVRLREEEKDHFLMDQFEGMHRQTCKKAGIKFLQPKTVGDFSIPH